LQSGDLPVSTLATVTYDTGTSSFILGSVVYSQFGTAARLNASDQTGGVSAVQIYAGNPNGHVAGNTAAGAVPPSRVWDSTDGIFWVCTTTGNSAGAVWAKVSAQLSDQLGGLSATQVYAGNPNGHVAGNAASGQIPPSTVWDTSDGVIWYCTTTGNAGAAVWIAPDLQFGGTIIATSQTVGPGVYYVDTSGGAVTVTVAAALTGVYTFIDAKNSWGTNNLTVNGGGHNIGNVSTNVAATFLADVSDYQFSIEAASTYWRLV